MMLRSDLVLCFSFMRIGREDHLEGHGGLDSVRIGPWHRPDADLHLKGREVLSRGGLQRGPQVRGTASQRWLAMVVATVRLAGAQEREAALGERGRGGEARGRSRARSRGGSLHTAPGCGRRVTGNREGARVTLLTTLPLALALSTY